MTRQPNLDRAADQACRCLIRLNVTSLPVRPLEMLQKCRNTVVYTYQQAAEHLGWTEHEFDRRLGDADAFTFRKEEAGRTCYVVCYRAGGNPARLNFTLAHELGHIVLSHAADSAADEAEADCFAQYLLCPVPALEKLRPLTAERVARACYVSLAAGEKAIKNFRKIKNISLAHQLEAQFSAPEYAG